jgi:hypothetical protein
MPIKVYQPKEDHQLNMQVLSARYRTQETSINSILAISNLLLEISQEPE